MNCIGPKTPEDYELLAYADGEASPELTAHLSACSGCQIRARELRRDASFWRRLLYRADCPTPLELGERYLSLLPAQQADLIGEHLRVCTLCRREIAMLEEVLAQTETAGPPEAVTRAGAQLRTIIARLSQPGASAPGVFPSASNVAPALRGPSTPNGFNGPPQTPLAYDAEDFLVTVEFWPEGAGRKTRQLVGVVVGPADFEGAEVEVAGAGGPALTASVDEFGNFIVPGVAPGAHQIIIKLPSAGAQVRIDELAVN